MVPPPLLASMNEDRSAFPLSWGEVSTRNWTSFNLPRVRSSSLMFRRISDSGSIRTTDFSFVHVTLSDPYSGVSYLGTSTDDLVYGSWVTNGVITTGTSVDGDFDTATNSFSTVGQDAKFAELEIVEK